MDWIYSLSFKSSLPLLWCLLWFFATAVHKIWGLLQIFYPNWISQNFEEIQSACVQRLSTSFQNSFIFQTCLPSDSKWRICKQKISPRLKDNFQFNKSPPQNDGCSDTRDVKVWKIAKLTLLASPFAFVISVASVRQTNQVMKRRDCGKSASKRKRRTQSGWTGLSLA